MDGQVLFIGVNYAPERSGTAPFTTDLAQHLAASGRPVTVVTGFPHYPDWVHTPSASRPPRITKVQGVCVRRVNHYVPHTQTLARRLRYEVSFAFRSLPLLIREGRRSSVAVTIAPGLVSAFITGIAMRLLGVPIVLWLQDSVARGAHQSGVSTQGLVAKFLAWLEARTLLIATRVVTISDEFARIVVSQGVPSSKVRTVRNWAFLPEPTMPRDDVRKSLGWNENEWVLLHAGNVGLKQGLEAMIDSARTSTPGVRYVMLGGGSQVEKLRRRAEGLENVEFLPAAGNVEYVNILRAADSLLVCERRGVKDMSLPSKLTAYARAERPIISYVDSDGTTARELRGTDCSLVVDNTSPASLIAEAASWLKDHPERAEQYAIRAKMWATEAHDRDANLAALEDWIASV